MCYTKQVLQIIISLSSSSSSSIGGTYVKSLLMGESIWFSLEQKGFYKLKFILEIAGQHVIHVM